MTDWEFSATNLVRGLPYAGLRKYPYSLSFLHVSFSCCFHITTHKRSLRRLCFHRCLSVHRSVSAPLHAGIHTPSPRTRGRHPPWADTPHGQTTPWADNPLSRHPPGQVSSPGRDPSSQCMLGYGQQAGGTHPTGMHSCFGVYCVSAEALSQEEPILQAWDMGISLLYIWIQSRHAHHNLFTKECF